MGIFLITSLIFAASSVRINEVAPAQTNSNGLNDWIELYVPAPTTIKNWTLRANSRNLRLSQFVEITTGPAYIVINFSSHSIIARPVTFPPYTFPISTAVFYVNPNGYYDVFFGSDDINSTTAMTTTDGVVYLSSLTQMVDAFVYANNNGDFTGSFTDFNAVVSSKQWNGPAVITNFNEPTIEAVSAIWTAAANNRVFGRDSGSSDLDPEDPGYTWSKNYFGLTNSPTKGSQNNITLQTPASAITTLQPSNATSSSITFTFVQPSSAQGFIARISSATTTFPGNDATNFFHIGFIPNSTPTATGASSLITWTVSNLLPGATYWVVVLSTSPGEITQGNFKLSAVSNISSFTTLSDSIAPDAITDLTINNIWSSTNGSILLTWTSPNDPPHNIAASEYVIRYSTTDINLWGSSVAWWSNAIDAFNEPVPKPPSTKELFVLSGLPSDKVVYIMIRAKDAAGNISSFGGIKSIYIPLHLIISEVVYDTTLANDVSSYVELFNPLPYDIPLTGFSIAAINGADGSVIANYPLIGAIPASGYFLISDASPTFNVAPDQVVSALGSNLQNGPDGVQLLYLGGVVDVVGWGSGGSGWYFEGKPASTTPANSSLFRTALEDTNVNFYDFSVGPPSPKGSFSSGGFYPEKTIIINEVFDPSRGSADAINGVVDWIELVVPDTTSAINIYGWILYAAGDTLTLPDITIYSTDTTKRYIVIQFCSATLSNLGLVSEDNSTGDLNDNGYWDIYIGSNVIGSASGLPSTDGIIYLKDNIGGFIDAMGYSNMDGSLSTTARSAYNLIKANNMWVDGPTTADGTNNQEVENALVGDIDNLKGRSMSRAPDRNDNNRLSDWIFSLTTKGYPNHETFFGGGTPVQIFTEKTVEVDRNTNPFSPYDGGISSVTIIYNVRSSDFENSLNIQILDIRGRRIATLVKDGYDRNGNKMPYAQKIVWDGRNEDGTYVPIGVYVVHISAVNTKTNEVIKDRVLVVVGRKL
ncbi:MAG: lamin tail domain-containing protein [bacterium]|nr:lamin tail domain-containing protein [bacterium]